MNDESEFYIGDEKFTRTKLSEKFAKNFQDNFFGLTEQIKLKEVKEKTKIPIETLKNYTKNNPSLPDYVTLVILANYFQTSPDELCGFIPENKYALTVNHIRMFFKIANELNFKIDILENKVNLFCDDQNTVKVIKGAFYDHDDRPIFSCLLNRTFTTDDLEKFQRDMYIYNNLVDACIDEDTATIDDYIETLGLIKDKFEAYYDIEDFDDDEIDLSDIGTYLAGKVGDYKNELRKRKKVWEETEGNPPIKTTYGPYYDLFLAKEEEEKRKQQIEESNEKKTPKGGKNQ